MWIYPAILIATCLTIGVKSARREVVVGQGSQSFLSPIIDVHNFLDLAIGNKLERIRAKPTYEEGLRKVKFQQTFHGVPVYGTVFTAEQRSDHTFTGEWRGELIHDIEAQKTAPTITVRQALYSLKKAFGHHIYRANDVSVRENGTLYICLDKDNKAKLSYLVRYLIEPRSGHAFAGLPAKPYGIVDAHTGQVLDKWHGIVHLAPNAELSASTFAGTSMLNAVTATPQVSNQTRGPMMGSIPGIGGNTGKFGRQILRNMNVMRMPDGVTCKFDTNIVQVQHMANQMVGSFVPFTFKCNDAMRDSFDYLNGGYNSLNDIAVNTEMAVAMFKTYTGRNGPIDVLPLRARVHYGTRYENAFWDGQNMVIGDGATTFFPLVGLDVVAHEYGHGFTGANSKLQYAYQSGGMNEAFSDMTGEAAEFFATGKNDFQIGSTVMKDGSALRYMCDPTKDRRSIDSALKYNNFQNVHHTSGVYNKAFCLLATSAGWTTASAYKVFARANELYWGAQSGFDNGACGVQHAAQDLGFNVTQVVAAFRAVDVKCA